MLQKKNVLIIVVKSKYAYSFLQSKIVVLNRSYGFQNEETMRQECWIMNIELT